MIGLEATEQRKFELASRLSLGRVQVPQCNIMCVPIERAGSRGRFTKPARVLPTDLDSCW